MITLRDYQHEGVEAIRDAFRRGVRRPLYVAPTGSGKTVLFAFIAQNAACRGKRVCILVHRRELLFQTARKLNHPHGLIAPGFSQTRDPIQIASVATLTRRLDRYASDHFDLLIVDEAHHTTAATWLRVIEAFPKAFVLGVTATPCRMTGRGLGDVFEEIVQGPTVQELTDAGWLAPAEVYAPAVIDMTGAHTRMGDWVRSEVNAAADTPVITGCAVEHYRRYADHVPAIAFCVSVSHAENVAAQFRAAGYAAESVDGTTNDATRDARIAALGRGNLDILTSCELISEGIDVPVVGCGILLRPTQSTGLALQQMGRILRPSPGKDKAIILDHAGNCLRHGLPASPREWSLEAGAIQPSSANGPAVRQCPACYYVHGTGPRQCPACGFIYKTEERIPEQVKGELQKVTPEMIAAKARRVEQGRASSLDDLQRIERERAYKPGWAHHVWRARRANRALRDLRRREEGWMGQ